MFVCHCKIEMPLRRKKKNLFIFCCGEKGQGILFLALEHFFRKYGKNVRLDTQH